jgi:hypothetical protein
LKNGAGTCSINFAAPVEVLAASNAAQGVAVGQLGKHSDLVGVLELRWAAQAENGGEVVWTARHVVARPFTPVQHHTPVHVSPC